jgi:Asp-tRNA(Asn)/Glu-tRNA(Gln) amidotransferase A subunit family amidase
MLVAVVLAWGPSLNAVQTINRHALQYAERLDAAAATSGPVGPLHCIPMLVKDQVETSDRCSRISLPSATRQL